MGQDMIVNKEHKRKIIERKVTASPVPTPAQPLLQAIYQTRVEQRTSTGQARPGSCALLARMASCSVPLSLRAASAAAASSSRRRCRHWSLQASLSTLQAAAVLQQIDSVDTV